MCNMLKWQVIVFICGFFMYHGCADVVITELSGTNDAEYGSGHSLQCSYDYQNETGVEIKWFYNGDDQIFVWIPNRTKPNAIDSWKAVLHTNDTSQDHDRKHSVIHFKELNFNLTGYYTCKVTGDEHEATKTEKMIVYQPASFVEFDLSSEENNTITLRCSVYELYPKPVINVIGLYLSENNATVPVYLKNETIDGDQDIFYNVTTTYTFNKDELLAPAVEFVCNVTIQGTKFSVTKSLEYTKSGYETTTTEYPEYFYNDTTISTETEIAIVKSSIDNIQKQGGKATRNGVPYAWQMALLLGLVYIKQQMV